MRSPELHETVIDGVDVRWIESPPPFFAALFFRVGRFDETLLTSGITHAVEHLALVPFHDRRLHYNGWVDGRVTAVHAQGKRAEVLRFVTEVCQSFSSLPLGRLSTERRVLSAEAAMRPSGWSSYMLRMLFGAQGPGLLAFDELGLRTVTAEAVESWAHERFTKSNCMVVMSGPPPDDLELHLPDGGTRFPSPQIDDTVVDQPDGLVFLHAQDRGVTFGSVTDRSIALPMATMMIEERLRARLRSELGLVYSTGVSWLPLARSRVFVSHGVDCEPSAAAAVSRVFVEELRRFAEDGPTDEERFNHLENISSDEISEEDFRRGEALRLTMDELVDDELIPNEDITPLRKETSRSDVRNAFAATTDSGYIVMADLPDLELPRVPNSEDHPVSGKAYRAVGSVANGYRKLIVAEDALTAVMNEHTVTVKADDVAAMEVTNDKLRWLLAQDGRVLRLDSDEWWRGKKMLAAVDQLVPAHKHLPGPDQSVVDLAG